LHLAADGCEAAGRHRAVPVAESGRSAARFL